MAQQAGAAEFAGTSRFEVRRRLGAGGMGVVYEAYDRERGAEVALKTLRTWSADALLRFKNEFRALQDIQHPNLVSLGELFEEAGTFFFTMELVRGASFLQWVRPKALAAAATTILSDSGASGAGVGVGVISDSADDVDAPTIDLPSVDKTPTARPGQAGTGGPPDAPRPQYAVDEGRLRAALVQLTHGLQALHAAQKVHRDVKPGNILVTDEGRVVVLDFGLVTGAAGYELWPDDHLVGTASYMAPEQATGAPVGPAADWYAVGVVLYQALTGRLPLIASAESVVIMKQAIEPTPPRLLVPEVPADLDRLCVDLLRIDPSARPSGRDILRRLHAEPSSPSLGAAQGPRFVGRARELRDLRDAFDRMRDGRPVAVFVEGESGVGKSALAHKFADQLLGDESGAVVFAGRCYERESVPYKAVDGIVDAMSRYLGRLEPQEIARLMPAQAGLIGQVFPVMRRVAAVAQAPRLALDGMDAQELRTRIFAALRELMSRLGARRPLVLVIDDLQWADADSLQLIAEVLRPPDPPRLLLVATVRAAPDHGPGVASGEQLAEWIPCELLRLALGSLPARDAEQLVRLLVEEAREAGADLPLDEETVAAEAGGHPLFIDELVRCKLVLGDAAPERLDDALWARISRLDDGARRLLELIAVAGAPIAQETAAHAAAVEFAAFAVGVNALRSHNLLRTHGVRRSDAVEPYHDRVRDAVLGHLAGDARRRWHERLALALEASGGADAERLSTHWLGAGELDKAADYAVRAADDAAAALAFDRAARLYRLAISLRPPRHDGTAAPSLHARLGDALANAGRGGEAADAYLAALALPGGGHAPAAIALELQRNAADQLLRSGHIDRGLQVLRTVLAAVGTRLPETPNGALASLLVRRARIRLRGLRFREQPPGEVPASTLTRIDTFWSVASGLAIVDTIRGADFQTRGLLLALGAGEPYRIARSLGFEAGFSASAGVGARARTARLLGEAGALVEKLDQPQALALYKGAAGMAAFLEGRWRAAVDLFDAATELFVQRCTGVAWEQHTAQLYAMISLFYLGRAGELQRRFPSRLQEALDRGNLYAATTLRTALANAALLAADEPERLRRELHESMQRWSRQGFHLQHYWDLMTESHLDLYTGRGAEAHRRIGERWPALARSLLLRIQVVRVEALHLRARAALAQAAAATGGERGALLAVAAKNGRKLAGEKLPGAAALAEMTLAAAAHLRGDDDGARMLLGKSIARFDEAEMKLYAAAARARLAALVGGDEGKRWRAESDAWLSGEKVRNPRAMIDMLAPGF